MALDSLMFKDTKSPQAFLVDVTGNVAIGATGAVGVASGKGFTVTRTGVGLYTIQFPCAAVPAILFADLAIVPASAATPFLGTCLTMNAAAAKITIQTSTAATPGTAADPASGSVLSFRIVIQNASTTG